MKQWQPSVKMGLFVDGLLQGLNITEASSFAGASRDSYYKSWRKNPKFLEYLENRRREAAGIRLPKIDKKLFEEAEKGDISAMRLVYEVFGGLRTGQVNVTNTYQAGEGQEEPGKKVISMLDELEKRQKAKLNVVK